MKRQCFSSFMLLLCILLSVILLGCDPISSNANLNEPRMTVTGRYIRGRSGQNMILVDEEHSNQMVAIMGNSTGDETVFASFQTGDRIRIVCNNFLESYPAQTNVFTCEWLEAGSIADIPQEVVEHLTSLGHMDEPITVKFHRYVNDKDINITATYRALWGYQELDTIENAQIQSTGLQLYSWPDREMTVDILYHADGFTLDALPVISTETVTLDSGLTAIIYTQKDNDGNELITVVFDTENHSITAQYRWNSTHKQRYQEDVLRILHSITFSIQYK